MPDFGVHELLPKKFTLWYISATIAKNISIRNARTYPNLPSSAKKCPGIAHFKFKR
jgi:hypothetical protein